MKKTLVIPTYNEADNIERLLSKISSLNIEDLDILVVDDNSPDGTGKIVDGLREKYKNLEILHREKKEGLGRAYVAGFRRALNAGADVILEMDADFSHDPRYIFDLLEETNNHDLVLGSRYISGGGTKNWGIGRRVISRMGNIYARIILGTKIKDMTGGFKCYRREVLERIDLATLGSVGYGFQIETTYRAYLKGFSIKEVPIIFTERRSGKSKFNWNIINESFWNVLMLRIKHKNARKHQ